MDQDRFGAAVTSRLGKLFDWLLRLGWGGTTYPPSAMDASPTDVALGHTSKPSVSSGINTTHPLLSSQMPGPFADWDVVLLASQVLFSAVAIIWLGAHGALRRPPSASPSKGTSK